MIEHPVKYALARSPPSPPPPTNPSTGGETTQPSLLSRWGNHPPTKHRGNAPLQKIPTQHVVSFILTTLQTSNLSAEVFSWRRNSWQLWFGRFNFASQRRLLSKRSKFVWDTCCTLDLSLIIPQGAQAFRPECGCPVLELTSETANTLRSALKNKEQNTNTNANVGVPSWSWPEARTGQFWVK